MAFEMVRQCESDGVTDNLVNASKAHLLEVAEQLDVTVIALTEIPQVCSSKLPTCGVGST